MPATTIPTRLIPSWVADSRAPCQLPTAKLSATVPAAGTVVTEMNTPTRVDDFAAVSDSTPAVPASSAMTNDQPFGWRMNAVAGPVLASAALIHPKAYATDQQAHANTVAIRNPPSSRVSAGASSLGRGLASAKQIDEMGAN